MRLLEATRAFSNLGSRIRAGSDLGQDVTRLFWGMLLWNFAVGTYAAFWPLYIESLDATPFLIGMLIGGQAIIRIALTLPSGIVADRASRRRLILITTFIGAPAAVMYGVAQTWWHLIPGLIVMALTGFSLPALSSYIADTVPARDRARAFTLIYTIAPSIAFIIAPLIGGIVAEASSLRALFFIAAAMFVATTGVFWRISDRPHTAHEGPKASYVEAINVPVVRMVCTLQFLVLGLLAIGITLLPNYLQDVHALGVGTIGQLGAVAPIGSILISTAISRTRWLTPNRGIALSTFSIGGICAVTLATGNVWILSMAFLMRGGFMVASALFTATVGDLAPERLRGRAFALADFTGGAGFGLAPFAAGALYAVGPSAPLVVTAVAAPLLIGLTLWVERRYVQPVVQARLSPPATPPPTVAVAEAITAVKPDTA